MNPKNQFADSDVSRSVSSWLSRCVFSGVLLGMSTVLTGLAGCGQESGQSQQEIDIPEAPDTASTSSTGDAPSDPTADGEILVDGITFTLPAGWRRKELDPNAMQFISAEITLPSDESRLTLSTVGGGVDANIQRWFGQFPGSEPSVEELTVGGRPAKWVDIRGRFQSGPGMGAGPRDDWMMLGVAISNTPRDFYIKLTGPRDEVSQYAEPLREFVDSARF